MKTFEPHMEILPEAQRRMWPNLDWTRKHDLVLYGGTAIALQCGHRFSVDFDFFSEKTLEIDAIFDQLNRKNIAYVTRQDQMNTVSIETIPDSVKLSFFGKIEFGRMGEPLRTSDDNLIVASSIDLMATKLKVVLQRSESKDYLDIFELLRIGVSLEVGLGAACQLFGSAFAPQESLRALNYYGDGDLDKVPSYIRISLQEATMKVRSIPHIEKQGNSLTGKEGWEGD